MNKLDSDRAGFWQRLFALLIDALLIKAVFTAIALLLFGATQGYIRIDDPLSGRENCVEKTAEEIKALGISLPQNFEMTRARDCEQRLFGVLVDRKLDISDTRMSTFGSISTRFTQSFDVALDRNGRPQASYFYIDNFTFLLFAIYVVALEWYAARTLGKRLLGIRVKVQGRSQPADLRQVIRRFIWRFSPFIIVDAFGWLTILTGWSSNILSGAIWAVCVATLLAIAINFLATVPRRNLPWHDRIAGTEVVRDAV